MRASNCALYDKSKARAKHLSSRVLGTYIAFGTQSSTNGDALPAYPTNRSPQAFPKPR
ncbi:MAG: hypothetical protein ACI84E_000354, partial [Planctomycetota bacterium]